jgi:hypothetical protein
MSVRRTLVLALLLSAIPCSARALSQTDSTLVKAAITLDVTEVSIDSVLRLINRQIDNRLMYEHSLVAQARSTITYRANGLQLRFVLDAVLKGTGIEYHLSENGRTIVLQRGTATARDSALEVIQGRVLTPDSTPAQNVMVVLTATATGSRRATRTSLEGRFSIGGSGGGEYELVILMIGAARYQKHVSTNGRATTLLPDIRLSRPTSALAAVTVTALKREAPKPEAELDSSDRASQIGLIDGQSVSKLADLGMFQTRLIGTYIGREGLSVLGMSPSQTSTSMNGVTFLGPLTPTYYGGATFRSASFDASVGGFSGGQISIERGYLSNRGWVQGEVRLSVENRSLQWTDPTSARFGGLSYDGYELAGIIRASPERLPVQLRLAFDYNLRNALTGSLLDAESSVLTRMGVAPDSLDRLLEATAGAGLPRGRAPQQQRRQSAIGADVVFGSERHTRAVSIVASWERTDASDILPSTFPTSASLRTDWGVNYQGFFRDQIGDILLNELTLGGAVGGRRVAPLSGVPAAQVLVTSTSDTHPYGTAVLGVGGGRQGEYVHQTVLSGMNDLTWQTLSRGHRLKLHLEGAAVSFERADEDNRFGTFTYNSIADFESGRPASFERTIHAPRQRSRSLSSVIALSDSWRAGTRVRLVYGARLDAVQFLDIPRANVVVDSVFGERTDRVPSYGRVSPRAGFTILLPSHESYKWSPGGRLFGGIGQFRGAIAPEFVNAAASQTGLASGSRYLSCVGNTVPAPNWSLYFSYPSSIPSTCVGGGSSEFAVSALSVSLFAHDYLPPARWSASVGWSATLFGKLRTVTSFESSTGRNIESAIDLNLRNDARFVLANEGGRPIFSDPGSIVPTTGAAGLGNVFRSSDFSHVFLRTSDLRSKTNQLVMVLSPPGHGFYGMESGAEVELRYARTVGRAQSRGFTQTTSGDPFGIEWSPLTQPLHDIGLVGTFFRRHEINERSGALRARDAINIVARASSGAAYTPRVLGDINGDGLINDRAFVFDPAVTADPALAEQMQGVLSSGRTRAVACLRRQLRRVASANSCRGPWTIAFDAEYSRTGVFFGQFGTFSLSATNLAGGLDQMLHGYTKMRGWGDVPVSDATLLTVTGFDPMTQAYRYEVNPRFGETRLNAFHRPFMIQARAEVHIFRDPPVELMVREMLAPPEGSPPGTVASRDTIRSRFARWWILKDMPGDLLAQRDSIMLLDEQVTRLVALRRDLLRVRDSLSTAFTDTLLAMGPGATSKDILHALGWKSDFDLGAYWTVRWAVPISDILTPEQRDMWGYERTIRIMQPVVRRRGG